MNIFVHVHNYNGMIMCVCKIEPVIHSWTLCKFSASKLNLLVCESSISEDIARPLCTLCVVNGRVRLRAIVDAFVSAVEIWYYNPVIAKHRRHATTDPAEKLWLNYIPQVWSVSSNDSLFLESSEGTFGTFRVLNGEILRGVGSKTETTYNVMSCSYKNLQTTVSVKESGTELIMLMLYPICAWRITLFLLSYF